MILYFTIIQIIIITIAIYKIYNDNSFKTVFNWLILPVTFYYAVGHLVFSKQISKSIGWNPSPFQSELGYFTLSLFLISLYASMNNVSTETMIYISNIWILFIILASLNHIKEIILDKNYNIYNIFPIFITIITSSIVIMYQ
tara:strand:+ start:42 stop:467 length:426 start_codon:yes stop_codon:yes gene_type:complete